VNAMDAMMEVYAYLNDGDFALAQCAVMAIEQEHGATLPSSVFEKVLRLAIANGELTFAYEQWCKRAYGKRAYAEIVSAIAGDNSPLLRA